MKPFDRLRLDLQEIQFVVVLMPDTEAYHLSVQNENMVLFRKGRS